MARTKASRGIGPFQMRSGNSPNKMLGAMGVGIGNSMKNMKAMMEAKKAADAAGEDWDTNAWVKENLEGGVAGTLKNQGEGGFGAGIGGIVAGIKAGIGGGKGRFAAMHDKLHGKDGGGIEGPNLQPGIMSKKYKYTKK